MRTYKPFTHAGKVRRELYAIRDGGLHLNMEGTSKLKIFLFKSNFYSIRLNYIPLNLISGFVVLDFADLCYITMYYFCRAS